MYVAGDPSIGLVFLTCLGGALSAGGAGAINHAVDRDIDRMMARTADRPVASGRVSPARGDRLRRAARLRLLRPARAHRQPAGRGALALRPARLRLRLHALAEAHDAAEHRDRRRRRRGAAAGRLGGGHRRAQRHRPLPLRDRLLLDPAPLLGALAADEGRVREGRRADAAGGPRRGRDPPPDPPLHRAALRGDPAALLRRRLRRRLPGRLDDAGRRLHLLRGAPAAQRRPPLGAAHLPLLARLPGAALRRDGRRRQSSSGVPDRNPAVDRETARAQHERRAWWPAASPRRSSPSPSSSPCSTSPNEHERAPRHPRARRAGLRAAPLLGARLLRPRRRRDRLRHLRRGVHLPRLDLRGRRRDLLPRRLPQHGPRRDPRLLPPAAQAEGSRRRPPGRDDLPPQG